MMTDKETNKPEAIHPIRKFAYSIMMVATLAVVPSSSFACMDPYHDETEQIIEDNHDTEYTGSLTWETFALDEAETTDCNMSNSSWNEESGGSSSSAWGLRQFITYQFKCHQIWLLNDFLIEYIVPMMQNMTEQLVSTGMHQVFSIGALMDAETQLETQRLLQRKMARAHKDYHPSVGMCVIGTNVRSLGPTARNSTFTAVVMSQRALDRHQSMSFAGSLFGPIVERDERLQQYIDRYCNLEDNNHGLEDLCTASADPRTINKDIDFARTIDDRPTLNVNLTDDNLSGDEIDVFALASYLYGHDVFKKPTKDQLQDTQENIDEYMDMRSVLAKRSVAENSYNAIVGLKAAGSSEEALETALNMHKIYEALGVNEEEAIFLAGEVPSYFSQMEMLSQKIYQSPQFYTNLYDKPANVARKDVAMQAIGLMLDRDAYKSELRTEAMLAVILELEISHYQNAVQDKLTDLDESDKTTDPIP